MPQKGAYRIAAGSGAAAVIAALGLTALARGAPNAPHAANDAQTPVVVTASTVSPTLANNFAVFDSSTSSAAESGVGGGESTTDAGMPPGGITNATAAAFGLVTSHTHFIPTSSGGVWVVPGSAGACMVVLVPMQQAGNGVPVTNCEAVQAILSSGMILETGSRTTRIVAALVPNGDATVSVTTANDKTAQLRVTQNIVETSVGNGVIHVSYSGANGQTTSRTFAAEPLRIEP